MNRPQHRIAILHRFGDDADGQQVVNLIKGDALADHLLVDAVQPLDAALDHSFHDVFLQLLLKGLDHAGQELLSRLAAGFHGGVNLVVADGIDITEGQIFEFAAHLAHAETVGQRSVDFKGLACNLLPADLGQMLQRAHVVQPVGQFDQHHANVIHHGEDHLADVLGLALFTAGEVDLVDLGHTLDDMRHMLAEFPLNIFGGHRRVFDGVMQQTRRDGGGIQLHVGQHNGHFQGMNQIGFTGGPHLAFMVLQRKLIGLANNLRIVMGTILDNLLQQLLILGSQHLIRTERLGRSCHVRL